MYKGQMRFGLQTRPQPYKWRWAQILRENEQMDIVQRLKSAL